MFSNADKTQAVQVQLALNDGRSLAGKIICPADSNLLRILNGETGFFGFHRSVRCQIHSGEICNRRAGHC